MQATVSPSHAHNNFDFIRFIAALFVLVTHSYQLSANVHTQSEFIEQITDHYFPLSYFGVSIFFVISGFLISQSLFRSSSTVDYLRKRVVRIFPGLITVVLLCILLLGPVMTTLRLPDYFTTSETYTYLKNSLLYKSQLYLPGVFLNNPDGTKVNGSLWTLVYEFSFYLILLFCYKAGCLKLRFLNLIVFIIGLSTLPLLKSFSLYYYYYPSVNMSPGNLISFGLFFWSGVLAFLYKDFIRYTGYGALLTSVVVVTLISFQQYVLFESLAYILLPYLIFYLAYLPGSLNRFGRQGDFSYGIYIYAFPIQQSLFAFYPTMPGFIMMCFSALLVMPLAWMSWFWIEAPSLRWGRQQAKKTVAEPSLG